jgi:adenylosuccinate synthase
VIGRYARRVNGVTDFVLTKLDVLTGREQVPVCVAYDVDGTRHTEMPMTQTEFHHAVPVYEYLEGWTEDVSGARSLAALPSAARRYVSTVEELCGAPVSAVGVGPTRDEIIAVRDLV